jgi:hypothetical protein
MIFKTEPETDGEKKLLENMISSMGEKEGMRTWRTYSMVFTIQENTNYYEPQDFYKAREGFIKSNFEADKKTWP